MRFLERWRFGFLAVLFGLSSLVLSLSPLLSSQASATSIYDDAYRVTDDIEVGSFGYFGINCAPTDLSLNWYTVVADQDSWYRPEVSSSYESTLESLDNAIDHGSWAVSQYDDYGGGGYYSRIVVVWTENRPSAQITFDSVGYARTIVNSSSQKMISISIPQVQYGSGGCTPTITYAGVSGANIQISNDRNLTPGATSGANVFNYFASFWTVTYPSGYEGQPIQEEVEEPIHPDFGYSISADGLLDLVYLGDLDIDENYGWDLSLHTADIDYVVDSNEPALAEAEIGRNEPWSYQLPAEGHYVLYIHLHVPIPAAPRPDIKPVTIQLNYDGKAMTGNTKDCGQGSEYVCAAPPFNCSVINNMVLRMSCEVDRMFSLGVINPSITAIKNLLSSMVVPDDPTCSFILTDVAILPGQLFPLSQYPSSICTNATTFRTNFPLVPVLVNFVLAVAVVVLIVRLINRLTDNTKNDLVEGV